MYLIQKSLRKHSQAFIVISILCPLLPWEYFDVCVHIKMMLVDLFCYKENYYYLE